MQKTSTDKFDRTNAFVAIGVWLTALAIYISTQAPTLSLWDCGEFIATSVILGIPHPPGTPLYVMLGRIFSLIPSFADISARVNFLSGFTSSIAAVFGYLCAVRLLRTWFRGDHSAYGRILIYAGAASGALFLAFGRTGWANAVEAEVYGASMMLLTAIMWLTLLYHERRGTPAGDRLLLAIVYLAFLGIGIHMTTFLILPASAIVLVFKKDAPGRSWLLLASLFVMEFFLIFALSSRPGEVPYYVPIVIVFLLYLFFALSFDKVPNQILLIGAGLALSSTPIVGVFNPALAGVFNLVGAVSFAGVLLYAVFLLFRYFTLYRSGKPTTWHGAVAALITLITGFMTLLLLLDIKGYGAFLVISAALLIVVAVFVWRHINLPVLIALVGVSTVILGIMEFLSGIIVASIIILFLGLVLKMPGWKTALLAVLMAVIGFSVHVFVPIRSAQHPFINENNPGRSITATINVLERSQYGSQSMVERMFKRRAEWAHQFGVYRRMGFWSFFQEQYGLEGPKFFALFVLGLFGIWEAVRRRKEVGLFVTTLLVISSVGLVLYMNFADGTRQDPVTGRDYIEVRDRDYFFTPAFMLFGLTIGLGLAALVQFIREAVVRFSAPVRKIILAACLAVFLSPAYALAGNWYYCDRSDNYIPYEYAWDLLAAADKNAVLFTNGDNDTFPLWCLQEAYGIRKDVKIVNLTLSNLKWYTKQIHNYMGLNLNLTDKQIDDMQPFRLRDGRTFRLQDQVADAIIDNNPSIPINFSVTVGPSARMYRGYQIDSMLTISGLKYIFDRRTRGLSVNPDESVAYFSDTALFTYKSMSNHNIYKCEATQRVIGNVTGSLLMNAEGLRQAGRHSDAKALAGQVLTISPTTGRAFSYLTGFHVSRGEVDSIEALQELYPNAQREIRLALAQAYRRIDRQDTAQVILDQLLIESPTYQPALDEMMRILVQTKDVETMIMVLQRWVYANPEDVRMKRALQDLLNQLESLQSDSGADQ